MEEKLLVIQALDEREYLVRRIYRMLQNTKFVDTVAAESVRTCYGKLPVGEFCESAQKGYPEILNLIEEYVKLEHAILCSDTTTRIMTSRGEYTVAAALAMRRRMRGCGIYEHAGAFEKRLCERMEEDYNSALERCGEECDTELIDTLNVCEKIAVIKAETEEFLRELDKKILLSNATTYVEIT